MTNLEFAKRLLTTSEQRHGKDSPATQWIRSDVLRIETEEKSAPSSDPARRCNALVYSMLKDYA
jgi:hypothetical protein